MILKCETCGKEFDAKRKDTRFCKQCKAKRRSYQVMVSRKKKIPETEIGVGSGNSKSNRRGMSNHNTTTGIMLYRDMIDTSVCSKCGSTKNLLVHHLDSNRTNNKPENLVCLCKRCHQLHHCKRDKKTGRFISHKALQTNTELTE